MGRQRTTITLSVDYKTHQKVKKETDNLSKTTEKLWRKYILGETDGNK